MEQQMDVDHAFLNHALKVVFTPLCRVLIRCRVPVRQVIAVLKQSYVDAAELELSEQKARVSVSAISRLTGITRQEVSGYRNGAVRQQRSSEHYSLRDPAVLSTWAKHTAFTNGAGEPLVLPMHGDACSFASLVELSCPGRDPAVVAARLEAGGNIVRLADDSVMMLSKNVTVKNNLPQLILDVLGAPATTLIANSQPDPNLTFSQKLAFVMRPSEQRVVVCRHQMRQRVSTFIEEIDQQLVALTAADSMTEIAKDRDSNARIGVGAFYYELDE